MCPFSSFIGTRQNLQVTRAEPLSLDASGAVAFEQSLDLVHGEAVEVAGKGMLQATGCDGEFESFLFRGEGVQAIDQAARERVAAAYRFAFGRAPTATETKSAVQFLLTNPAQSTDALVDMCHVLLNSNEFLYVD